MVDNFQPPLLLFNQSDIMDLDIWHTIKDAPDTTFLTVSPDAANCVNNIVIARMFQEKTPVSTIPLENDVHDFLPFRDMRVVVTLNKQPARHNPKQSEQYPPLEVSKWEDDVHLPCHDHH